MAYLNMKIKQFMKIIQHQQPIRAAICLDSFLYMQTHNPIGFAILEPKT